MLFRVRPEPAGVRQDKLSLPDRLNLALPRSCILRRHESPLPAVSDDGTGICDIALTTIAMIEGKAVPRTIAPPRSRARRANPGQAPANKPSDAPGIMRQDLPTLAEGGTKYRPRNRLVKA